MTEVSQMKLTDLEPRWFTFAHAAEVNPPHIGLSFVCPCGCRGTDRETRLAVSFDPPIGLMAGALWMSHPALWKRTGESFDSLTLTPSVDASQHGHWHGFITNGEIA